MAADALSRMQHGPESVLFSVSTAQPVWLQELQDSYAESEKAK